MESIKIIAFTHANVDLEKIGLFHLDDSVKKERLFYLKDNMGFKELMYLSTCNRVEFMFVCGKPITENFLYDFFLNFNPKWNTDEIAFAANSAKLMIGEEAVKHLFDVASSIDSLVIGEREIITQVRKAYEDSYGMGITGDTIRLAIQRTINAAKAVYTNTQIATKPVSVVSLAYKRLRDLQIKDDAHFLVIGSGKTNTSMLKFLSKKGNTNFTIYNRTLENAKKLVDLVGGVAKPLSELGTHDTHFDAIITCTNSSELIITDELYSKLLNGDDSKKIIVDLAIPGDFDMELVNKYNVKLIAVDDLKEQAESNLAERAKEIEHCKVVLKEEFEEFKKAFKIRKVELAMKDVPSAVKAIKEKAYSEVFANDISQLDANSKEILDKVVNYLEKKYISVPMKMARDIIVKSDD